MEGTAPSSSSSSTLIGWCHKLRFMAGSLRLRLALHSCLCAMYRACPDYAGRFVLVAVCKHCDVKTSRAYTGPLKYLNRVLRPRCWSHYQPCLTHDTTHLSPGALISVDSALPVSRCLQCSSELPHAIRYTPHHSKRKIYLSKGAHYSTSPCEQASTHTCNISHLYRLHHVAGRL